MKSGKSAEQFFSAKLVMKFFNIIFQIVKTTNKMHLSCIRLAAENLGKDTVSKSDTCTTRYNYIIKGVKAGFSMCPFQTPPFKILLLKLSLL